MVFADAAVDWTAIIQTTGGAIVLVLGSLGGYYLKILSKRQEHEKEMATAAHNLKVEQLKLEHQIKTENDEREAEQERKRDAAEARKESIAMKEIKAFLDAANRQHMDDRDLIHSYRNELQALKGRVSVCEAQRQEQAKQLQALEVQRLEQTKQLKALYDHLHLRYDASKLMIPLDQLPQVIAPPEEESDDRGVN